MLEAAVEDYSLISLQINAIIRGNATFAIFGVDRRTNQC
jgi:hypothetical protein